MFYRGWKFNMFNDMKQINKAISAVVIIFAMFFFSLASLLTQLLDNKKSDHQSLSLVIFTYTMICMFSYFNIAYVRDFDAIQVNITPLMLTICGLVSLRQSNDFFMIGMVITLLADSYCALRFSENNDQINFSVIERFAMESWCQDAFNKRGIITAQIVAVCLMFTQVYLNLLGAHNGEQLAFIILAFNNFLTPVMTQSYTPIVPLFATVTLEIWVYRLGLVFAALTFFSMVSFVLMQPLLKVMSDLNPKFLQGRDCLLYTSPSPRDRTRSRMPSSA